MLNLLNLLNLHWNCQTPYCVNTKLCQTNILMIVNNTIVLNLLNLHSLNSHTSCHCLKLPNCVQEENFIPIFYCQLNLVLNEAEKSHVILFQITILRGKRVDWNWWKFFEYLVMLHWWFQGWEQKKTRIKVKNNFERKYS